jgi:hypothetical protein
VKKAYRKAMDLISNPRFMQSFNGWAAIFFVVLIFPSVAFGWVNLVVYVSVLSIWALVASHWAAWQSARVEVKQGEIDEASDAKTRDMIEEIVKRLNELTPDPDK